MNRLRSGQLFVMLFLSAAFSLLCQTVPFTLEGFFGAILGCAFQLLLCLPMLMLFQACLLYTSPSPRD